jgi:hypothetical protein
MLIRGKNRIAIDDLRIRETYLDRPKPCSFSENFCWFDLIPDCSFELFPDWSRERKRRITDWEQEKQQEEDTN